MIEKIKEYTYLIVISVFVTNMIQLIAPKGTTRKYIIFFAGMIVTIVLVEPIINLLNEDVDINEILVLNQEKYIKQIQDENLFKNQIEESYKSNIENGIIEHMKNIGYTIHSIRCEYNETTLEPEYIYLEVSIDDTEIRPVKIEVSNTIKKELFLDEWKIVNLLKQTYGFKEVEVSAWENY